jgi:hypothetical protein
MTLSGQTSFRLNGSCGDHALTLSRSFASENARRARRRLWSMALVVRLTTLIGAMMGGYGVFCTIYSFSIARNPRGEHHSC